jgi:3-hydroxyisobutyrate dehydrogenase
VVGFDVVDTARSAFSPHAKVAVSVAEAVEGAEIIITMLPAGHHVREVYTGPDGVLAHASPGALLIDSSTIDVATAREVIDAAAVKGFYMLDAPVSGGVGGAAAGTLTFMVGGPDSAFLQAEPILARMGKTIVHCGAAGAGQAAKICNNMILGISMIGVSEAFALADKLGLDHQKLFDVSSKSSGQCWSLTTYCPVPGPVPASPANRDWQPGFASALMLKDLTLAQEAAGAVGAATPLGEKARALYAAMVDAGDGGRDFSYAYRFLSERERGE